MKTRVTVLISLIAIAVLAGCSTVESRISGHQDAFNSWPPPIQQAVRAGQIAPGFTREQVQVALGSPDRVFSRVSPTGSYEVWGYADHGPRFSVGIGMASFGRGSAYGGGVGFNSPDFPEEKLRVIFDQTGRVNTIEQIRRGR